ncbi:MAG: hypothetical protein KJZ54_10800 [Phycisphaerales bacterium]|nr:hypothetical protein [Phycisphaerales bacterium]
MATIDRARVTLALLLLAVPLTASCTSPPTRSNATDGYPLSRCPVSGRPLGTEAVVRVIDGREVRFCCEACPDRFEAAKAEHFAKIDADLIAAQLPDYPTDECIVTGAPMTLDGTDVGINVIYRNRLVRVCCEDCLAQFEDAPERYLSILDEARTEARASE